MALPKAQIPVIDLGPFISGSPEARLHIAQDLTAACKQVGFAYIVNHGIAPELVDESFKWAKKLFDLPQEQKMLAPHPPGAEVHRGYSWPGLEKVSQYIHMKGDDDDAEKMGKELRQVQDCKVRSTFLI